MRSRPESSLLRAWREQSKDQSAAARLVPLPSQESDKQLRDVNGCSSPQWMEQHLFDTPVPEFIFLLETLLFLESSKSSSFFPISNFKILNYATTSMTQKS